MLTTILTVIGWILQVYLYAIFGRILMSWFPDIENTGIGRILVALTEPYLAPFRRMIPPLSLGGMYLDLSVIVAVFAYLLIENAIVWIIQLALQLVGIQ